MAYVDITNLVTFKSFLTTTLGGYIKDCLAFLENGLSNGNQIKILPSHFFNVSTADVTMEMDGTGVELVCTNSNGSANHAVVACYDIPAGYKATVVNVHCGSDRVLIVYANEIDDNITATSLGSGYCNTPINITDDPSDSTNYLTINVRVPASGTSSIKGGYITLERI